MKKILSLLIASLFTTVLAENVSFPARLNTPNLASPDCETDTRQIREEITQYNSITVLDPDTIYPDGNFYQITQLIDTQQVNGWCSAKCSNSSISGICTWQLSNWGKTINFIPNIKETALFPVMSNSFGDCDSPIGECEMFLEASYTIPNSSVSLKAVEQGFAIHVIGLPENKFIYASSLCFAVSPLTAWWGRVPMLVTNTKNGNLWATIDITPFTTGAKRACINDVWLTSLSTISVGASLGNTTHAPVMINNISIKSNN